MGGMGTGGTGGMGTGGMSTGGAGGGPKVCDNGIAVDIEDANVRCVNGMVANTVMAPVSMVWADSIPAMNGYSSQFSPTDYSAMQATGVPDVYPASGDEPKAWASQTLDDMAEFIIVNYKTPVVAESVWVYETNSPGAITKITITAADGDHIVYQQAAATLGACSHIRSVSTKTCSPISAVRIDLDSVKVLGYNEIDAVGLLPAP
jgi:hypothetical protein